MIRTRGFRGSCSRARHASAERMIFPDWAIEMENIRVVVPIFTGHLHWMLCFPGFEREKKS
jgi:hypothetical protein